MSTLAVITDNEFDNKMLLYQALQECAVSRIITCDLTYTDILLREFAGEHKIPVFSCENEFKNIDLSHHFIRNRAIIDQSDILVVFWDEEDIFIKQSIEYAKKQKKEIRLFQYTSPT